jgi:protein-tyrosine-phosphatase
VIAAEHFNRLAAARALDLRAESAGVEPDNEVPQPVIEGLALEGIDVRDYQPRAATDDLLGGASHIVSFGCELSMEDLPTSVEQWSDMPMVSDGFMPARNAIVARVGQLLDTLT